MAVKAFSSEWASAFKDEVNKSTVYKAAGKGWKWTVGLVVEAEPEKHFAEARGIVLDLFEGEARDVKVEYPTRLPGIRGWFRSGRFTAVEGVDFDLAPGETLGVIGSHRFRQLGHGLLRHADAVFAPQLEQSGRAEGSI